MTHATSQEIRRLAGEHGLILAQEPVRVTDAAPDGLADRVVHQRAFRVYQRAVKQFADGSDREPTAAGSKTGSNGSLTPLGTSNVDRVTMLRYDENPPQENAFDGDPA